MLNPKDKTYLDELVNACTLESRIWQSLHPDLPEDNDLYKKVAHQMRALEDVIHFQNELFDSYFAVSKSMRESLTEGLQRCVDSYLRVASNGGMPQEKVDYLKSFVDEVISLYGSSLMPILQDLAEKHHQRLTQKPITSLPQPSSTED